jgi:hypothetical protein
MNGVMGGQGGTDSVAVTTFMTNSNNQFLVQDDRHYNTQFDWTRFSGTVGLPSSLSLANAGSLGIQFVSGDSGFWGGYYGPQVRNVEMTVNYSIDPCVANPGSSPSCPGYASVVTSPNLVPAPNHWTTNGQSVNQTYAINQALGISGAGFMIHGFDYGYRYNLGGSYSQCTAFNQDGSCSWTMTFNPQVNVNMSVKNNQGTNIYSVAHTEVGNNTGNRSRDFQYRFASSRDALTLGAFGFTASTAGNSTVWDMYSRAVYTPDQCTLNPLGDSTCPGYAAALFAQQCSINTLYDPACPGYAQAYFDQQCSLDALYNSACPGYASAYYNYQCTADALYHTGCPGYAQAFLTQQCTANPLYSVQCTGYADAYYVQQCNLSPLYDSGCTGYAQAYFDQQCGLDALYNNQCAGYGEAYALKYIVVTTPAAETTQPETVIVAQAAAETKEITAVSVSTESAPAVSASPASAATAPVSLAAAPAPAAPAAEKKTEAKTETRTEAAAAGGGTNDSKNKPATTRQALAERRMAATRAAAAQSAQNNAGAVAEQMDSAASMEQQVELQNVVLGAMGFVAGFDAYGRAVLPDAAGYRPFEIYRGQANVDTPAARGLLGRSDRLHSEMVDSQYNK